MILILKYTPYFLSTLEYLEPLEKEERTNIIFFITSRLFPATFNILNTSGNFFNEESFAELLYYGTMKMNRIDDAGMQIYRDLTTLTRFKKTYQSLVHNFELMRGEKIEFLEYRHARTIIYRTVEDERRSRLDTYC